MSLIGHNVVIIGGSSGMGFATARLAKDKGANVIIASRSSEKLQNAEIQLGNINAIAVDISHESEIRDLFEGMEHVDHVFVSAAQPFFGKILETELETFRREVDQRFWGSLYVVRSAAPKMKQGSITFITGQFSSTPVIGFVVTSAMLSAVEMLIKGLALELAPIRVNAIAPGAIDTPFPGEEDRQAAVNWARENLPVKRIGTAEEVAQAALMLMTNGFITGEVLHIDGGGRFV